MIVRQRIPKGFLKWLDFVKAVPSNSMKEGEWRMKKAELHAGHLGGRCRAC